MIFRCIWRIFIIWIHTNSNLCFYCGRAAIYFPRINVICDMLNRNQISLTGRGEEYIHIHICFYYFYVNLYEYDEYILWCFICCMHPFGLCRADPGPCITNVFATRRKNFSQWHRSFQRKLLSHWLKFLRHVAITLVIQGPGIHRSLDARLGSVQIRVIPHLFSVC